MNYCKNLYSYSRRETQEVNIGGVPIGGSNPIRIQTMTTTNTNDILATVEQCIKAAKAGADYVRITTQGVKEATSLSSIKQELLNRGFTTPIIADIHFNPNAAMEAAKYADKVRINPGNFVTSHTKPTGGSVEQQEEADNTALIEAKLVPLLELCRERGVALRIGVNHGSLSERIMAKYGDTPEGMVESALEFIKICARHNFRDIVVSMKASNVRVMVQAVRLLAARMLNEGMEYPIHLGVTEAGNGEDGRIKSAVGIGTLLADGIGDTVRVSLTEDPENEIPVAKKLVSYFENRSSFGRIPSMDPLPYNPFSYTRRKTIAVGSIGADNPPVVVANLSLATKITGKLLSAWGWTYNHAANQWEHSELAADYFYIGSTTIDEEVITDGLPLLSTANSSSQILRQGNKPASFNISAQPICQMVTDADVLSGHLFSTVMVSPNTVLILRTGYSNGFAGQRAAFIRLMNNHENIPVIISREYDDDDRESFQLKASADIGGLLVDGLGDGVMVTAPAIADEDICSTVFSVLQAARTRITKTDYIACPGCGRTLFNLQQTLEKVKAHTGHLRGLKIAVMGCIVNGPGEMADADYGYVGAGPGRVTLYKGKQVMKKNIPEEDALDELIGLINADRGL